VVVAVTRAQSFKDTLQLTKEATAAADSASVTVYFFKTRLAGAAAHRSQDLTGGPFAI
jgi:hypothetical protein